MVAIPNVLMCASLGDDLLRVFFGWRGWNFSLPHRLSLSPLQHSRITVWFNIDIVACLAVMVETATYDRQRRTTQHNDRHVTIQQHIPARDLSSTTAANPSCKNCRNSQCELNNNLYMCPLAFARSSNPSFVEIRLTAIVSHEVNSVHFFSQRKHMLVAPF